MALRKNGTTTLRNRIGSNHLRGTIRGSTFRRTLGACLRERLGLGIIAPGRLAPDSERALSSWMHEHLTVAVHPFPNRDVLGNLESEVLTALNPPLNLERPTADGNPHSPESASITTRSARGRERYRWTEVERERITIERSPIGPRHAPRRDS